MTQLHGFELVKKQKIEEVNSEALLYRHIKTGAELVSIVNDDENKVFGITFRTPSTNSTGVPHILEHSVLCGSRKYPVKEPFVELLKGSLQTFLNAFTYPDKTCYPVASQNLKDFYNLVDVYLDAVFYPRIGPLIFQQEGWHYEIEDATDPLKIKGVVYNEMKGAYSSPDNLLMRYSQQSLFPDVTYSMESGGDPKDIPLLTYEDFYDFHKRYYHPSNSKIFFYGDDDPDARLKLLDKYLNDFNEIEVDSSIGIQDQFSSPVKIEIPFVAETEEGKKPKGMVAVNWLLCESSDIETNFSLQLLTYILLGMPSSPLKKALIESGLGERLAGVGFENELRQMYFSTGLKGIDVKDAKLVEDLIIETLSGLAENGIDVLTIEAALNTVEFALRENNTGSYPRGLSLMLKSLTTWLYDSDPFEIIAFEKPLQNLKNRYTSNPAHFQELIKNYLLDNQHRTVVILYPDTELAERESALEIEALHKKKVELTAEDISKLVENTKELKLMQETHDSAEALESIPRLKLSEIDKNNKIIPINEGNKKVASYYHDIFTNEILYFDLGFRLNVLPQKYLPYMTIFGKALLEMGTKTEDYVSLSQRINRKTGGISRSSFSSLIKGTENPTSWFFLRCKALIHQVDDLLEILNDIIFNVRFDNRERFKQIVLETKSALEQSIIPAGNRFVNLRINSHFNKASWAEEQMGGVSSLFFLRELADRIEHDWTKVLHDLQEMYRIFVSTDNIVLNATIDEQNWKNLDGRIAAFSDSIPSLDLKNEDWQQKNQSEFEGLVIPSQVNYVGKGANLYQHGYSFNGSVNVITHFLRTSYLWDQVRVQGGAYGAMCQFNRMSGVFTFVSYRDPNLMKTLNIYDRASDFLKNINISESEVQKSVIGAIGDIDSYMLPDAKGYASLLRTLNGNTDADRQLVREQVLATTEADFKAFAVALDAAREAGIVKTLGSRNALEEAYKGGKMPDLVKVL